jgi:uncharacterized protein (TIGR03083 family)
VTIDFIDTIETESARVVAALRADPDGVIPWSDGWTVKACAQHLGSAHHVVAQVIEGRPATTFSVFADLHPPGLDDPGLPDWVAASTGKLLELLRSTAPSEECWTWWDDDRSAGFWARRMAHETLVHRWDVELGAGIDIVAMNPQLAADGVDEYLDVFLGLTRQLYSAPGAGETVHVHCTDTDGEWLVGFPAPGERTVLREHAKGDLALRGPAEGLLLHLWGRRSAVDAGVEVLGDAGVADRWRQLAPAM